MHSRFRSENGEVLEYFLLLSMVFIVTVFILRMLPALLLSDLTSGTIMEKKHQDVSYSQDFTLGERVVEEDEKYILMLDTDNDGEADKEKEVNKETYEEYKTGEKFDTMASKKDE